MMKVFFLASLSILRRNVEPSYFFSMKFNLFAISSSYLGIILIGMNLFSYRFPRDKLIFNNQYKNTWEKAR